jgi:hypothetical protein
VPRWRRTLFHWDPTWDQRRRDWRRGSSKRGVAAAGVGARCPVIGTHGEDNGFRPTAHRTIMVRGDPMEDGEVPTVSVAVGALTGTGKALTVAGFTGLIPSGWA